MDDERAAQVSAVAALAEPTRRRLYDHVVRQEGPVSRDDAAAATDVPRATVAFHLDKLVDEGLLDVVFERRTGRSGPGAGRPSKLYRRAECDVAVSLPERRYDLAGGLLATALEEALPSGEPPREVLELRAFDRGRALGVTAREADGAVAGWVSRCAWSRSMASNHVSTTVPSPWPTARSTPWPGSTPSWSAA